MPNTYEDVLPLARVKRELNVPEDVHDDDVLLVEQRDAAVAWCLEHIGKSLDGLRLPDPLLASAGVQAVRQLYDGIGTIRPTATLLSILAVMR